MGQQIEGLKREEIKLRVKRHWELGLSFYGSINQQYMASTSKKDELASWGR